MFLYRWFRRYSRAKAKRELKEKTSAETRDVGALSSDNVAKEQMPKAAPVLGDWARENATRETSKADPLAPEDSAPDSPAVENITLQDSILEVSTLVVPVLEDPPPEASILDGLTLVASTPDDSTSADAPLDDPPNDEVPSSETDDKPSGTSIMSRPLIDPGDWKPSDSGEGFLSGTEHLEAELKRVDLLIKISLLKRHSRRVMDAQGDQSVQPALPAGWSAILASPYSWNEPLDTETEREIQRLERLLNEVEVDIVSRLPKSRSNFEMFCRRFDLVRTGSGEKQRVRDTVALDVLLLAFLVDRVPRYRALLDLDHDSQPRSALTTEQALRIVQHRESSARLRRAVFYNSEELVSERLIIMGPLASQAPASHYFWIDPRISSWLVGANGLDPKIADTCSLYQERNRLLHLDDDMQDSLQALSEGLLQRLEQRKTSGAYLYENARTLVLLRGPWGTPFLPIVQATSRSNKLLIVDLAAARAKEHEWVDFVRRCYREAYLLQWPIVWHHGETLMQAGQPAEYRETVLSEAETSKWLTFITSTTAWDAGNRFASPEDLFLHVDVPLPSFEVRERMWEARLRTENPALLADSAAATVLLEGLGSFQFTEGQVESTVAIARGMALWSHPAAPAPTVDDLYEGCRRQSARHLVSFSQRIQPRSDANDLARVVVPAAVAQQLRELAAAMSNLNTVHHRLGFERRLSLGRGLIALFTGPSGTGKTWAATLLAGSNNKDLYKVDMAATVSKYVGETEKNLDRIFQDAQNANAVLFFDEADALFGKRGSVEQAQDRWANLEVNFLLQRIEDYTGTVILATNFRDNIDDAFLRRMQVVIQFPIPDAVSRLRILQGMFPAARKGEPEVLIPPPQQDQKDAADRFELTGGSLKNVTLDAVFRAVSEQQSALRRQEPVQVAGRHLVLGVAREYQKLNRPVTRGEFGAHWFELAMTELQFRVGS